MKGFTFIETLVSIAVFTLAIGAVFGFINMIYRTHGYTWEQAQAINEARKGIGIMIKEIKEAGSGEDGSYAIELARDKEFIFYSDIDDDGKTERVRYFLGTIISGNQTQKCVTYLKGGTCSVNFSNFLQGALESAQVKVSIEGDFGASNEYAEIYADGIKLGNICQTSCSDCASAWQGTAIFDVTSQAADNTIQFLSDATFQVDPSCNWEESSHSMKVNFEFSWTEEIQGTEFKKGVIEPVGFPPTYPLEQEAITVLSSYVRNAPPIFEYFDQEGNKILDAPARLKDTKLMKVYLMVNVNPNRPPQDFELQSFVQLRNLKTE
jgi:type II secretory pathway pseudopilin PulG